MTLMLVNSSSIRAVGYDGHTLSVQFHTSDTVYDHHGVPYSVYAELMNASSRSVRTTTNISGENINERDQFQSRQNQIVAAGNG